ncbi:MAG: helix-turn-helix domain-containing protein [Prevotellaceae bacterium]|jgi:transcriptional regulator with XRE-family HTH domain|nr:helix-turn-helix domain-containing protein [Prevotellaceae bacterium]
MKDRIKQFLASKGLSPTQFADLLKVQRSGVSHILAGRNMPSYDFITKMLLTFPNINAEWLLLGKGAMHKSAADTSQSLSLFDAPPPQNEAPAKVEPPAEQDKNVKTKADMDEAGLSVLTGVQDIAAQKTGKTVESITIFYSDKTFCRYQPE